MDYRLATRMRHNLSILLIFMRYEGNHNPKVGGSNPSPATIIAAFEFVTPTGNR